MRLQMALSQHGLHRVRLPFAVRSLPTVECALSLYLYLGGEEFCSLPHRAAIPVCKLYRKLENSTLCEQVDTGTVNIRTGLQDSLHSCRASSTFHPSHVQHHGLQVLPVTHRSIQISSPLYCKA